MPIYENDNFNKTMLPTWVKKDQRELIEVAMVLGWKLHISSADSLTIISHDERKKYHFSASGRTSNSPRRMKRDIVRFAHPDMLLAAHKARATGDKELDSLVMASLPEDAVVDHRPELEAEREQQEQEREQRSESLKSPSIVSTKPMMAKASEGTGYPSRVAIERTWSDGSIDYKCVDCDYSSKNRLSIRGHYASHRKGPTERPQAVKAEVPNAAVYKPRRSRIEALAEVLRGADLSDPFAVAEQALLWVNEQSRKGTAHAEEREPMTAEEIVTRIRSLLDDGSMEQALRDRDDQIESLQGEVSIYRGEMEKLSSRVEELESFIELASTLRRKDSA